MNFSHKLTDFAPWDNISVCDHKLVLVNDRDLANGDFAFISILIRSLQQRKKIYLLSFNYDRLYYEVILRKYGIEINNPEIRDELFIYCIDYFSKLSSNNNVVEIGSLESLQDLAWNETLNVLSSCGRSDMIFINDIQSLEIHAPTKLSAMQFLNSIFEYLIMDKVTSIIVRGQSSTRPLLPNTINHNLQSYEDTPSLTEILFYRADINITVAPLQSGYSNEVHGQLIITQGFNQQTLLYKALETGIHCLPIGSGSHA